MYNPILKQIDQKQEFETQEQRITTKKFQEVKKEKDTNITFKNEPIDEFELVEKIIYKAENADFKEELIAAAQENLGSQYQIGGISKNGFDCSGFVFSVFKDFDVILPRTSIEMSQFGRVIIKKEMQKGDLIFFKTNGNPQINHVGIIIEQDGNGVKFIHSSTQKGVIISTTKEGYYQKTFAQANRIVE